MTRLGLVGVVQETVLMLDAVGAVAILLWGLHMVRTGIDRAFGLRLRGWIAAGTRNRVLAVAVGLAATVALQSSTATALMTSGFVGGGFIGATMAQAIMLGANVGTSLVTRILAFDIRWISPLLIALGVISFSFGRTKTSRSVARAVLGLGLILLSLAQLGQSFEPMRQSTALRALLANLDSVPALAALVAAVLAVAASSSMAVVLLIMSLAAIGSLGPSLSIAMVAGANVGGAITPIIATLAAPAPAKRVMLGNFMVRLGGCIVTLALLQSICRLPGVVASKPDILVTEAHIVFNILLAILMLPLLGPFSLLMNALMPGVRLLDGSLLHLRTDTIESPAMAIACATRETLNIGDKVMMMLQRNFDALQQNDASLCSEAAEIDDEVDRMNEAVKLYLSSIDPAVLNDIELQQSSDIIAYATNLEHIGDILDRSLRVLIDKKIRGRLRFSTEGAAEINDMYQQTIANLQIAQGILISRDTSLARRLVEAKVDIRRREERSANNHLNRLRDGQIESMQTSSLHLDILRDLKRVNAHISAIAQLILTRKGELQESRLVYLNSSS